MGAYVALKEESDNPKVDLVEITAQHNETLERLSNEPKL